MPVGPGLGVGSLEARQMRELEAVGAGEVDRVGAKGRMGRTGWPSMVEKRLN